MLREIYNSLSLKKKIAVPTIIGFIPLIIFVVFWLLPTLSENLMQEKRENVKQNVEVAYGVIQNAYENYEKNLLSLEEAENLAIRIVQNLRYDDGNYFWINDTYPMMVMHPIKPELNQKSLKENKDPNGIFVFNEMVKVCTENGGGFVNYSWSKPGFDEPVPKVSYVKYFKPLNWVIGSGIYLDDALAKNTRTKTLILIAFLVISLLTFFLLFVFAKQIVKPVEVLEGIAEQIVGGNYDVKFTEHTKDEIGSLAASFEKMVEKLSVQIGYLEKIPTPIMIIDTDFNIEYMNQTGAEVVGSDQKSLIGKKCYDQFKTEQCQTEKCALAQAMSTDTVVTEETIARPKIGELSIMYTGSPVKDKSGNIIGAIEYVANVTDMKERENYLTRSTETILHEMEKFSYGDLTVKVIAEKEGDDISKLFNGFNRAVDNIKNIVSQVKNAVEATASASTEISSSAEEMAAGAQEQSSQTAEVAAAMEEMSRTIVETASNATVASEASQDSASKVHDGTSKVDESKKGMEKIVVSTESTGGIISSLANKTDQIGEIAQVIDDIADQTNLLALNAAIEAARAGEQGRGFAVVADEVRRLAERTTKATKEIAETIKAIQGEAKDANVSMQEAGVLVNDGLHLNEEVGKVLTAILDGAENVSSQISQVAAASEEQSATAEQVSTNIEAINNVVNESANGVQQIASASEDLNRLTENLSSLVKQFKIDNEDNYGVQQNRNLIMHN
jgi:methyl-accepting chemotaxis protein